MMLRIPSRLPLFAAKRTIASWLLLPLVLVLQSGLHTAAAEQVAAEPLTFVYGNEVWIPGWKFYDGGDWSALICRERECRLLSAELTVKPSSWRGHHDDRSTAGQTLTFAHSDGFQGDVVVWIRHNEEFEWLSQYRIETYHVHGMTPVLQEKTGTYEIVIKPSDDTSEHLAPVVVPPAGHNDDFSDRRDKDRIYLQLRAGGDKQVLSEQLAACSGELRLDYLLWAGDLDWDGKTDYLISYLDGATGSVKFYLSSFAREKEIVGLAGTGISHALHGECD